MAKESIKPGEISKPRFEYRTFGQDFNGADKRMARLSVPVPENLWVRNSSEIYIISRTNNEYNTKIRDGKLDIKNYVRTVHGLEQWNPLMKAEFPINSKVLSENVFPAFQVEMFALEKESYTLKAFLSLINSHPDLQSVRIQKERFAYMVNNTICEVGNVFINGAKVVTINSESTEIHDVLKTIKDVGLEKYENINYLQAIKRVIGMIDKPLTT